MFYVTATIANDIATVLSVHTMGHVARAKADRLAAKSGSKAVHVLPVNSARPNSVKPVAGDKLATSREDGEVVAVANLK